MVLRRPMTKQKQVPDRNCTYQVRIILAHQNQLSLRHKSIYLNPVKINSVRYLHTGVIFPIPNHLMPACCLRCIQQGANFLTQKIVNRQVHLPGFRNLKIDAGLRVKRIGIIGKLPELQF